MTKLIDLTLFQFVFGAGGIDRHLLFLNLRFDGGVVNRQPLLLQSQAFGKRVGVADAQLGGQLRLQVEAGEFHITVGSEFGVVVLGLQVGKLRSLVEFAAFELHAEIVEGGLSLLPFPFRIVSGQVHVGIAERHDDIVGFQDRAGPVVNFVHAAIEGGWDPDDFFRVSSGQGHGH